MPITVSRRDHEGYEVLMRRFLREIQHTRLLAEAKSKRYFDKGLSRTKKRVIAIRKAARRRAKRGY
jgi:ribosomal protein S21